MPEDVLVDVARRWRHDPAFREDVRAVGAPAAAHKAGFKLEADHLRTLGRVDFNLSDEEILAKGHKNVSDW